MARKKKRELTEDAALETALRDHPEWRRAWEKGELPDEMIGEAGSRFVERMLSVVATCRQQNRNVLELLTACCLARLDSSLPPSLLPAEAKTAAA